MRRIVQCEGETDIWQVAAKYTAILLAAFVTSPHSFAGIADNVRSAATAQAFKVGIYSSGTERSANRLSTRRSSYSTIKGPIQELQTTLQWELAAGEGSPPSELPPP